MTTDIRHLIDTLSHISESSVTPTDVKHGLNPQQRSVHQLPAQFKPKSIRALGASKDPAHPASSYFVGGESVEEEQDTIGKTIEPTPNEYKVYIKRKQDQSDRWIPATKHPSSQEASQAAERIVKARPEYEYIIRETDGIDENTDNDIRTKRMMDLLRQQFPSATSDQEALLLSISDTRQKTRTDIENLEKEIDDAESDLRGELSRTIGDIKSQRSNLNAKVNAIQASDDDQEKILDRIISIEKDQQDALDDLEQSVKNQQSPASTTARKDIDALTKTKPQRASRAKVKAKLPAPAKFATREPEFEPDQTRDGGIAGMQQRGLPKPRLAATRGKTVPGFDADEMDDVAQSPAVTPISLARTRKVSEQQDKPRLKRIHYFRVNPNEGIWAQKAGLQQDRGGNWVLLQYNTSGRGFDQKFTQAMRLFGRPVRSDNADDVRENQKSAPVTRNPVAKNVKRSGAGAHKDPRHLAQQGKTKHPKRDQEVAEAAERVDTPLGAGTVMGKGSGDTVRVRLDRLQGLDGFDTYEFARDAVQGNLSEGADNLGGWKKKTARDVERIQKLLDKEQRTAKPGQLRKPNTATQRKVYTNPKNLDYLASLGTGKYTVKESGETYVWTAEFADGSREQLTMATDEVPYAKAAFEKKFPNKQLTKVDTDWKPVGGSYYSGIPTTAMPDRRPTEPYGRDVDNPMIREAWTLRGSKTRDNLEVKVYHDAERGRWALQMFVDGEYRPEETQHFDNAQDAKEALKVILNFGLKESTAMRNLSETIAEIEEDMISKVKHDLTKYLDSLQKQSKDTRSVQKKMPTRDIGLMVDEDPTAVDTLITPPPAPVQNPTLPEATVKTVTLEDGCMLEIYGDELQGFGIRRQGHELGHRFPKLDHAEMAIDLYRAHQPQDLSRDYVDER